MAMPQRAIRTDDSHDSPARTGPTPSRRARARMLVVEDHDDTREALAVLLKTEGYETTVASDGEAGLASARASQPDVAIGEIFLPGPDGRRPLYGGQRPFQEDPQWRDLLIFPEYVHGDNGAALGASHQTGWTGLAAVFPHLFAVLRPENVQAGSLWPHTGGDAAGGTDPSGPPTSPA